jgi:hydrogenase nickel incorporation protein HypA/HybF
MHELSIAQSLMELALQEMQDDGADRVTALTVRIGELSCIHVDALRFCFEHVVRDTPLSGALLKIVKLPVAVYCSQCQQVSELPSIQNLQCPICNSPSGDIRQGRELDLQSIEVVDLESCGTANHFRPGASNG